jgi:hypothetical protein
MRTYPFALAVVLLLVAASGIPGAAQGENDMCKGRTAEATATELMNRLSSPIVRVLVKLKGDGQDRATLDHDTARLAAALRQDGALLAEPIGGQPLVVVEIDRDRLPRLARHAQVACIAEDALGTTQ